jgi:hypothetical protein
MTDAQGSGITEKQLSTIAELEQKKKAKPLTDNQEAELRRLVAKRDAPPELSETCKEHLLSCYIEEKYGRKKEIRNKFIEKGTEVEEDSITLYSRATKNFHKKNQSQVRNDWFIGTPDLFEGENILEATEIIDIKSSWDIHTFFSVILNPLNKMYYWQLQAYMDMTGAKIAKLAYCLVNTPDHIINDEKRKLAWRMGATTDESPEAQKAFEALEFEMKFDDIDLKERYIQFTIERNDADINKAKERIVECRRFLMALASKKELAA